MRTMISIRFLVASFLFATLLLTNRANDDQEHYEHVVLINDIPVTLNVSPFDQPLAAMADEACEKVRKLQTSLSASCSAVLVEYLQEQLDTWLTTPDAQHKSIQLPFLKESNVYYSDAVVNGLAEIDSFRAEMLPFERSELSPKLVTQKKATTLMSVAASMRIEGSGLTDLKASYFLRQPKIVPHSRDEEELLSLSITTKYALAKYGSIEWTEDTILDLHTRLLNYVEKDKAHRGVYKKVEINVNAYNADGDFVAVVMESTPVADTQQQMKDLLEWYKKEVRHPRLHPLVRIAVFTVVFLKIHPFEDGNGRLSRLLTDVMLLQCNYMHTQYYPLESLIEQTRWKYYEALQATQQTLAGFTPNWTPFLEYFVYILKRQIEEVRLVLQDS